jgi:hypothetical protein
VEPVDPDPDPEHWLTVNSPLLDQLIVKQKIEALEAISGALGMGFETQNKYKIKNSLGQVSRSNSRGQALVAIFCYEIWQSRIDRFQVSIKFYTVQEL